VSCRVRAWAAARRSSLPLGAACVVANGARESLSALLAAPVELRVCEPSIPRACAWRELLRDALLYRVRGSLADAVLVLRPDDAGTLAAALFGERAPRAGRALSPFERDVLDRTIGSLAAHLGPLCGARETLKAERVERVEPLVTYFELSLLEPVVARLGVALTRDPSSQPQIRIEAAHLAEVPIAAQVRLDLGAVSAHSLATLATGTTLPLRSEDLHRCALHAHGRAVARGTAGLVDGRCALRIDAAGIG
jgi:flagellar motor switch protein FliM